MLERIGGLAFSAACVYGGYQAAFDYAAPVVGHSLAAIGFALWVGHVVKCAVGRMQQGTHA